MFSRQGRQCDPAGAISRQQPHRSQGGDEHVRGPFGQAQFAAQAQFQGNRLFGQPAEQIKMRHRGRQNLRSQMAAADIENRRRVELRSDQSGILHK